ncbi:TPA: DUF3800 domain-containing protein [Photobacterium damselae]
MEDIAIKDVVEIKKDSDVDLALVKKQEIKQMEKNKKIAHKKELLLRSIDGCNFSTLEHKVGWILNHYPECRNSDIKCQLHYWNTFQRDLFNLNSGSITVDNYSKLLPLTSITRPRAKIQNDYNLFLANEEVRKYRGTLRGEHEANAVKNKNIEKSYLVFADESGKTEKFLLVGSLWILDGVDTAKITLAVEKWRAKYNFNREIHFKEIKRGNIDAYLDLIDVIKDNSTAISFKAIGVERVGIAKVNDALNKLFYYLLVEGVKHEHESGRAPLPRKLKFIKDEEEAGSDKMMLKDIENSLDIYSGAKLHNELSLSNFYTMASKDSIFVQIADLFTGAINRKLNGVDNSGPKDILADKLLASFGITKSASNFDIIGDCAIYENL